MCTKLEAGSSFQITHVGPFQGKPGRWVIVTVSSVLDPGRIAIVRAYMLLTTAPLFAVVLWVLWMNALLVFRAKVLGPHPSDGSLKNWSD